MQKTESKHNHVLLHRRCVRVIFRCLWQIGAEGVSLLYLKIIRTPIFMTMAPLSWLELEALTDFQLDTVNGSTNAQAR